MKLPYRLHSVVSAIDLQTNSGAAFRTSHPRLPQLLSSFQLKVLWVFQDRKRFDNVIDQLDFLLSNLEKITETLQSRREMAENTGSEQRPSLRNWSNKLKDESGNKSKE